MNELDWKAMADWVILTPVSLGLLVYLFAVCLISASALKLQTSRTHRKRSEAKHSDGEHDHLSKTHIAKLVRSQ
jgi:hypothetical protein